MDGFSTQFDTLSGHLYLLHGVDCTYTRVATSWTVRLIPHIGMQFQPLHASAKARGVIVLFRSLTTSADSRLTAKTASQTFVTPTLKDLITFNSEEYRLCPTVEIPGGWQYMNDRRSQIEICGMKSIKAETL